MPNWIGDFVMATVILKPLRKRFPKAEITVMCLESLANLVKEDPNIDQVFAFKKTSGFQRRVYERSLIKKLQYGRYDLGILMTHSFSSAYLFWRGKVHYRLGYAKNGRSTLLTHALQLQGKGSGRHLVETYKEVLSPLGVKFDHEMPGLYVTENEKKQALQFLSRYGLQQDSLIVGINPAAAYGPAKCWLPDRFRSLAQKLIANPRVFVFFLGDPICKDYIQNIVSGLPPQVINLAGHTTLRELVTIISVCNVFVSNDSGPMHIAAALQTPLVALFGSTSVEETGPYQFGHVVKKEVPCSPCYKKICPIDFPCMKKIEVEEVYQLVNELLPH